MMYQHHKQNILQIYDRAITLARTLKESKIQKRLEAEQEHLSEGKLFVVVCGEFKQGKSNLLNALLNEENLFPVDVDITTNLISTITYAPQEKFSVVFDDTRKEKITQISRDQIPDYVTEQKNQRNQKKAQMLVIEAPNPQLKAGLVFVDTPGTGSLNSEHTKISYGFIPYADAVLFVSDVQAPLTTNELDFIKERIFRHCQRLIFVVTKIDIIANYQEIVESNRKKLAETLDHSPEAIKIIPVSSQNKLHYCHSQDEEDLEDSNFEELENTIWQLVTEERGQILLMKALTELQQATSEMKAPVKAEWEAYQEQSQQELERLEKDIEEAQQQREKLLEEKAEWQSNLHDGIEDIQIQMEQTFNNEFAHIRNQSSNYLESSSLIESPKQIADLIEADIDGVIVELSKDLNQQGSELYRHLEQLTALNFNPFSHKTLNRQRAKVSQEEIQTDSSKMVGHLDNSLHVARSLSLNSGTGSLIGGVIGGILGGAVGFLFGGVGAAPGASAGAQIGTVLGAVGGGARGAQNGLSQIKEKEQTKLKQEVAKIIEPFLEDSYRFCKQAMEKAIKTLERDLRNQFIDQIKQQKEALDKTLKSLQQARKRSQEQALQRLDEIEQPLQALETLQGETEQLIRIVENSSVPFTAQEIISAGLERGKQADDL